MEKTFADGGKIAKFVKVFSLESFPLYGMLIAVRTCPYQTWTNPAERVMSVLNLTLQNVSLERKEMDEEAEKLIKNKNNMHAV